MMMSVSRPVRRFVALSLLVLAGLVTWAGIVEPLLTAFDEREERLQRSQRLIAEFASKAALRSLFELKDKLGTRDVELYFGPEAPAGFEGQWIKTIPGKGWFVYFRIYGPEQPAFDGSWKPGDFEVVR